MSPVYNAIPFTLEANQPSWAAFDEATVNLDTIPSILLRGITTGPSQVEVNNATMTVNSLPQNLPRDSDPNPYWCQICQKGFNAKHKFNSHQRRHKPGFACHSSLPQGKICDKKFQYRKDLTRHLKTVHAGNVESREYFACPHNDCDWSSHGKHRGFLRPDTLRRHLHKIHKEPSSSTIASGTPDS